MNYSEYSSLILNMQTKKKQLKESFLNMRKALSDYNKFRTQYKKLKEELIEMIPNEM